MRANDGAVLGTWTGANSAVQVLVAMGRVFVVGTGNPGKPYVIDPTHPPGSLTSVADLGIFPSGIAFDGGRIWTANTGTTSGDGSVSIVDPGTWNVTNVAGFNGPDGIVWDGSHMWMTQQLAVLKLDANANVLQTVPLTIQGHRPVFDGVNIWVPTSNGSFGAVVVVRASTGEVVATLPPPDTFDSGLIEAAFDGRRILVTDYLEFRVILWDAADLSLLGSFPIPSSAFGACSDGIDFWLTLRDVNQLARF